MDILYAVGYELYPQNKNIFENEFAANEKKYKEFIRTKIDEGYFENYMFFKLNRSDFKRFFVSYAVLAHMQTEELNDFINKQKGPLKVIDDFKNNNTDSIYFEAVNNTPYKLTEEQEALAFEEFQNLTSKPWGKKSNTISIEKVLKSFFESLSFKEGETNAYFRANYLAIYQMDVVKISGNLTRNEWLSIYSAVTNNRFFIKEQLPSKFLLQYELINYCINKGTQEAKYEKDVAEFLLYDDSRDISAEANKNKEKLISALTKQVKVLEGELALHKKEICLLNEQINLAAKASNKNNGQTDIATEEIANETISNENEVNELLVPFPKRVVYFGGHFKLHRKLSEVYPDWKFFDPDDYKGDNIISNAELIIWDKKYLNHGQSLRLKSLISSDTHLIVPIPSTNEDIILNDIIKNWNAINKL